MEKTKQISESQAWHALEAHYHQINRLHLRNLFAEDLNRFKKFSIQGPYLFLDYSKNRITDETLQRLFHLAKEIGLENKIYSMFNGEKINLTENRSVLHIALRNRDDHPIYVDGQNVMLQINAVLNKMREFSEKVRNGEWRGYTGKTITDVVNIGIGGSDLGPKMICYALKPYGKPGLNTHFVSNIDGSQIVDVLGHLDPETTLFIIASKTFTTLETLTNAETAKQWLLEHLNHQEKAIAQHFVALSTNTEAVRRFGIDTNQMFEFWDWVGGRYSVWSAIGLAIAILIGMDQFEDFLTGAYEMDQHFLTAPFEKNLPVILGLLGIWYRNFFHFGSTAIIPYDQYLQFFFAYLQQLDMESNGKSIDRQGNTILYSTGPVIWGGIGTDCQHSFHQLLHQGTEIIPIDFIVSLNPLHSLNHHHQLLFANCLAQSQALLQGKTVEEAYRELLVQNIDKNKAAELAKYKVMPGNKPSNTLLIEKLTPKSLGALLALYEHKVFVQGMIWNINSYDQWGVELGKQLAKEIDPYLSGKPITTDFDSSTQGLIHAYREK